MNARPQKNKFYLSFIIINCNQVKELEDRIVKTENDEKER